MTNRRWLWWIVLLMLPALACNAFAGATAEPGLPPPPTTVTENSTPVPNEEVPGAAPTATLPGDQAAGEETAVSGEPLVTVLVDLNVRNGPSVQYDRVGFLLEGSNTQILGIDPASGWWKIQCPASISSPECWISGGTQYSAAQNAAEVPVAIVPPTPTPIPAVLPENTGLLVYVDNGRLTATQLDLTQNPPAAKETSQLDNSPDVQAVAISPDGTAVAYLVQTVSGNELRLVNIDGRHSRTLVRSEEMPFVGPATELPEFAREGDPTLSVQLLQMEWVSNDTLAFNTGIINSAGFSPGSHSDLWTTTTQGERTERIAAGDGGPLFTISTGNQVLFSRQNAILRAGVDGSNLETVAQFEPVGISEAFYYPRPQWLADGRTAYVALSDQLSINGAAVERPTATILRIPTSGKAEKVGGIVSNVIFDAPVWSADGQRLAYVLREGEQADLLVADGTGQRLAQYIDQRDPRLLGWQGERLLYAAERYYAIGEEGEVLSRFQLAPGQRVAAGGWITNGRFITAVSTGAAVDYYIGNNDGNIQLVAQASGFVPLYDIWMP